MADKSSNGFSDLEMGPLLGKATHERKKKAPNSGGVPKDEPIPPASNFSPGRSSQGKAGTDSGIHMDKKESNVGVVKYSQAKSPAVAGKVAFSCCLYAFCSVSMVLVNKSLASRLVQRNHKMFQKLFQIRSRKEVSFFSRSFFLCFYTKRIVTIILWTRI
jgi:hypothetical protein